MDTVRPSISTIPRGLPEEIPTSLVTIPHWIARVVLFASGAVVLLLAAILWRVDAAKDQAHCDADSVRRLLAPQLTPEPEEKK